MLKATKKKLKGLWSKMKKKKPNKTQTNCYQYCCSCHCSSSSHLHHQPSAPPLPPWLNEDPTFLPPPTQSQFEHPDRADGMVTNQWSYQQYLVAEPVYGVPIIVKTESRRDQKWKRLIKLFDCFCPCFGITQQLYYIP
ncbi:AUX/IAA protein [Cucumis melo var. makuwa]|uniref:AUX/IAA protein n=2 Tax=Cucumis melo TaxID=3656 RepID=A0A5A7UIP5_CUCMM|nr:AUX/IAA protein [Cucumis melo var. makuwa]